MNEQTEAEYQAEIESEARHANLTAAEAQRALRDHRRAFAMMGAQRDADAAMHFGASREIVDRIRADW